MSKAGIFETIVGALVILVAGAFLLYAYGVSGKASRGAYDLSAVFGRVDGVNVGSQVRIAGVKVGTVSAHALDQATYEARVALRIEKGVKIPEDSIAKVVSDGLLGGAYISIEPGASDSMLADGGAITQTQGSVDLLGLAVQAFTSNAQKDGGSAPEVQ
ncbi:MAG: outer membrane lipid asymmetry maintenance protein MlaD [Parvularculaceae bacterium]